MPNRSRTSPAGPVYFRHPLCVLYLAGALVTWNLFCVLAVAVGRHGAPLPLDEAVHRWLLEHRNRAVTSVAIVVTSTGSGPVAYLLAALAGLLAAGRRRWWAAVAAMLALGAGQLVRVGLVGWIGRPRPPTADWARHATGPAFPSGHTTTAALVAGLFVLACSRARARAPQRRRRYVVVAVLAVGWALAVAATRVYLGVHWPTDVLGGWLLAGALMLSAATVVEVLRVHAAHGCASGPITG